MSARANPLAVGLFTLAGIALAGGGIAVFGSGKFFEPTQTFVLHFDGSVKGLSAGSAVKFRGVNIGSVTAVEVVFEPHDFSVSIPVLVAVDLGRFRTSSGTIPPDKLAKLTESRDFFDQLVERGLRAELKLESLLTGQLYIELDFNPGEPANLHGSRGKIRELPTTPSRLARLTQTIEAIPFEEVVHKVMASLGAIERLLSSPELTGSTKALEAALVEIKKLATTMEAQLGKVGGTLDETLTETRGLVKDSRESLGALSGDVRAALGDLRQSGTRLDALLGNLTRMTQGGGEMRNGLEKALQELVDAARAVRILAETIEARPESLLRGKPAPTGGK